MRILAENIITSPVDLSTSWESEPIWLGHVYMYAIQLEFTGAVQGVFSLQCSNDKGQNTASRPYMGTGVSNWTTIMGSQQSVTEAGDHTWDVSEVGYRWVKVVWNPSASSGSLISAALSTKGQ